MTEPTEKMTEADIRADERERCARLIEEMPFDMGRKVIAKWLRSQGGDDE